MAGVRYIIFTSEVNPHSAGRLKEVITQSVREAMDELYFLISSSGGNVFEGLSVAALIRSLPMNTIMHNIGQVDSVSTAIYSAAKVRYSNSNASFMFHGVTMNLNQGSYLEQQLRELHESARRLKADIANAISSYVGIALPEIEQLMVDGGVILNSMAAMEHGFVSEIREAQIPHRAEIISISNS